MPRRQIQRYTLTRDQGRSWAPGNQGHGPGRSKKFSLLYRKKIVGPGRSPGLAQLEAGHWPNWRLNPMHRSLVPGEHESGARPHEWQERRVETAGAATTRLGDSPLPAGSRSPAPARPRLPVRRTASVRVLHDSASTRCPPRPGPVSQRPAAPHCCCLLPAASSSSLR